MNDLVQKWLYDPTVGKFALALFGILIIHAAIRILQRSLGTYAKTSDAQYRLRKFLTFGGYLAMLVFIAIVFSDKLGGLNVAFGIAGAGIAFSLQEVIASTAGWVAITFGNFFSPGDRVQLGGIKGDVIDIGILRTTLMEMGEWVKGDQYNGRIVRVANSFVFKEPVFNYSADFPFLWDEITLPVRYGSDWEYAREKLREVVNEVCGDYAIQSHNSWMAAVKKYRLEDAPIDPQITLAATDNWIEFTARYVVDYRKRRTTRDRLFTRMLEEVDQSNNRIRLASATFEMSNLPRFDVTFRDGKGSIDPKYVP